MSQDKRIKGLVARWTRNPDFMVSELMFKNAPKHFYPSEQQLEGLREVGKLAYAKLKASLLKRGDKSLGDALSPEEKEYSMKLGLAIRSGHGCGKDSFLAWVYMWLMEFYGTENSRGQVTAPNQNQLKDILWAEFRKWIKFTKDNAEDGYSVFDEDLQIDSDVIYPRAAKGENFVRARTANVKTSDEDEQAEALAGAHADYMILAADEASGLPKGVFKPVEGAMTGLMNFAILIGNPTRSSGYFYDCFHSDRDRWVCLHWNAENSHLVNQDTLESDRQKYGRDSNWYRIRRLGEFPKSEPNALIPIELIEEAAVRELEPETRAPVIMGLDVGRGGDPSMLCERKGGAVGEFSSRNYDDSWEVGGWANEEMEAKNAAVVCVDAIGIGSGVIDYLRRTCRRQVRSIFANGDAADKAKFGNLRAEMMWKMRERFMDKSISIPDDEVLKAELSVIKVDDEKESSTKIWIVKKKKLRNILGRSPNKADALMLTFAINDASYRTAADYYGTEPAPKAPRATEDGWMGL